MATIINELGKITFSEDLLTSIAGYAAVENYGIVGMNAKRPSDALSALFDRDNTKKGVKVTEVNGTTIDVDLYVILEYGISARAVAENATSNVRYRVESMTGLKVRAVNIHVEGIRV